MKGNNYAAIDLGSNNCRLLIAKAHDNSYQVIDSFSRIVRLGEGLKKGFSLNENAIKRTLEALKICKAKIDSNGVTETRAVATEACRQACNTEQFYKRILYETGIKFETLSPEQEAQLTLNGCTQLLDRNMSKTIVFDIGGGSTEIILAEKTEDGKASVLAMLSLPIGVVTVSEQYSDCIFEENLYEKVISQVDKQLAPFDLKYGISQYLLSNKMQMLGTSGTVTTLGSIYLKLPRYDRSKVDGLDLRLKEIRNISLRLVRMSSTQRAKNRCIGEERADLIVIGCAILEAICRRWPLKAVRIADRGIREGLLKELTGSNTEDKNRSSNEQKSKK